jgi:hypothetical protein
MAVRGSDIVLWVVLLPVSVVAGLFVLAFFCLTPGVSAIEAYACLTQPACTVVSATHYSARPITGHFSGGTAVFMAMLLGTLAYLVAWLAVTRTFWLMGIIEEKSEKWTARLQKTDSTITHVIVLLYLAADTLLIRLVAGPLR